jgi:hypothetical protein
MRFEGLEPWRSDGYEVIECEVGERWYDLHNLADFAGFAWTPPDTLALVADYHPARWVSSSFPWPVDRLEVRLTFTGVRELELRQAGDFAVEAASTIDGWHFWPAGDRGRVEIRAGDAMARFTAEAVRFSTEPWAGTT